MAAPSQKNYRNIEFIRSDGSSLVSLTSELNKVTPLERVYTIATAKMQVGGQINLNTDAVSNSTGTTLTVNSAMSSSLSTSAIPSSGSAFASNAIIQFYRNGIKLTKGATSGTGDVGWVSATTIQLNVELKTGEQLSCIVAKGY